MIYLDSISIRTRTFKFSRAENGNHIMQSPSFCVRAPTLDGTVKENFLLINGTGFMPYQLFKKGTVKMFNVSPQRFYQEEKTF